MFKKEPARRRRKGIGPFRLVLSLIMFGILSLGTYSAYKSFSGVDPLKVSPKSVFNDLLSSDTVYNLLHGVLSFTPNSLTAGLSKNPVISDNPIHKSYPPSQPSPTPKPTPKPKYLFTFAVVADSENDNTNLLSALKQAKDQGAQFVVGLGDYTQVGTVDELLNSKKQFDAVGLKYYLVPGDHDLWDSRNRSLPPTADYNQIFGQSYASFSFDDTHFLLIDNSDNYRGVSSSQMQFVQQDLDSYQGSKLILVFVSTPLYHPSSDHVMGDVEPSLKNQANQLIGLFKDKHVGVVLGGDTHFYSDYTEPRSGIDMVAVGAITAFRNLQGPRYLLVDVYNDGSYNVRDTEIK